MNHSNISNGGSGGSSNNSNNSGHHTPTMFLGLPKPEYNMNLSSSRYGISFTNNNQSVPNNNNNNNNGHSNNGSPQISRQKRHDSNAGQQQQQQQQQQQHHHVVYQRNNSNNNNIRVDHVPPDDATIALLFKDLKSFPFRNRFESVSNTEVDIENPLVWNDVELPLDEEDLEAQADIDGSRQSRLDRMCLKLPTKRYEEEYNYHHFYSQINLLRLTNIIGIFAICYDGFQNGLDVPIGLFAIRIACFLMLLISITLSFFKNKSYYRRSYTPLFLVSFTAFFLTFVMEFINTTSTLILVLYCVLLLCLYALGCLMLHWLLLFNTIIVSMFMIYLGVDSDLDQQNLYSYTIYIFLIFVMGGSHLYMLEKYRKESFMYSKKLQKKAESLRQEKVRSDQLLSNILPDFVIKMIRDLPMRGSPNEFPPLISKDFYECTLLYCDIVDFTSLASRVDAASLVKLLNQVFTEFDTVVERNQCEKIKTDGDAYLCAGGLTIDNEHHFQAIVDIASTFLRLNILRDNCLGVQIKLRIGVATGSVIGGVIGCEKFQFDVWGEAIAKAHTLEETGQAGKIHIMHRDIDRMKSVHGCIVEENYIPGIGEKSYLITPPALSPPMTYIDAPNMPPPISPRGNNMEHVVSFDDDCHMNGNDVSMDTLSSSLSLQKNHGTDDDPTQLQQNDKQKTKSGLLHTIKSKLTKKKVDIEETDVVMKELAELDTMFSDHTRLRQWLVYFGNWSVELSFHRYVINKTLMETRFFLFIGMVLHGMFYFDDILLESEPVLNAKLIYVFMVIVFVLYLGVSFTPAFTNPVIYQCQLCLCVTFLNLFVLLFFFLLANFISGTLIAHLYPTDYLSLTTVLVIQITASYLMKLEMRKAWITKSKIKFKGLTLQKERERSAQLLGNILPKTILKQLMKESNNRGGPMPLIANNYNNVAVMFINIVGFEELVIPQSTSLLYYMNYIFTLFDGLSSKYGLEKIKTIGTTYMVVAGLNPGANEQPAPGTTSHNYIGNMADMALMAKACVKHINPGLNVQVGINYGGCVAGCIGNRFKFDVWGDIINTASRMQTSAPPGKIQITSDLATLLMRDFFVEERGVIKVKGKGEMCTYYVSGRRQSFEGRLEVDMSSEDHVGIEVDSNCKIDIAATQQQHQ
ncbi:hypothetical protein SAMD00019534_017060 [Acytostelium subglobosum LB1]|uniref:hypothetical protein n=1 Tax=Acytostelium subglobosum LB1 TaxID=1410327 RepID=UPI0006450B1F|nr:hypothetical protein SAMD00019534_017060 [Acytostelium subglobosum LB1]GAM18531.1 hypothetical protein SAMD00019534_017060 [Acytostelium subglobosum LB1]|eukprot:XP_012757751.1 hypothetical protein SAMD00019534_017060 [Acytostelium subglobosum LB1]